MKVIVGCKEIVDFMKKSGFYHLYARNTLQSFKTKNQKNTTHGKRILLGTLLGSYGTSSVLEAFTWIMSPEGYEFWDNKDDMLKDAFFEVPLKFKAVEKHGGKI